MIEHRDAVRLEQIAQAVGLARDARLGDAEEQLGNARLKARRPHGRHERASACTSVSGVPPDLEVTTKRAVASSNEPSADCQRDGIEIVVEARARAVLLRLVGKARDVPAAELRQRLAAEARAAGAEEDDGARADAQLGERRLGRDDVRLVLGDAQQRQAALAIVALQMRPAPAPAARARARARPRSGHDVPMAPSRQPAIECV